MYYFFRRLADGENPAGITVSKFNLLPRGDFKLTEYIWGQFSLWFVDNDKFTAGERQLAYEQYIDFLIEELQKESKNVGR